MFDPLSALLQRIRYLDETLDEPAKVVFLGDYIDYGPSTRPVIDLLLQTREERKTVFLCGNHEDLLLQFLEGSPLFQQFGNVWFRGNGGQDTVASLTQSPDLFRRVYRTPEEYCKVTPDEFNLPARYLAFFTSLQYAHAETFATGHDSVRVAFSHASLFQPVPDPAQPSSRDGVTVEQQLALRHLRPVPRVLPVPRDVDRAQPHLEPAGAFRPVRGSAPGAGAYPDLLSEEPGHPGGQLQG